MPDIEHIQGKAEGKPPSKRPLRGKGHGEGESEELELTPLMNILLVLIPFLATMAIFQHLAVIEFSLPPAMNESEGGGGEENASQEMDISIVITEKGYTIVGTGQKLPTVPMLGNQYDFITLNSQLKAIKYKYPQQESIILVIEPNVVYDAIIHFMDKCRDSQFPNIALAGGFQ